MPVLGSGAPATNSLIISNEFNVRTYGAVGNLVADDTAAIQAAFTAAIAAGPGNAVRIPPGFYKITAKINAGSSQELRVLGGSGRVGLARFGSLGANSASLLIYQGTSGATTAVVDVPDSTGLFWDGVSIRVQHSSFVGVALNLDSTIAADPFGHRVQNCTIDCPSGSPVALLSICNNIEFSADNVSFKEAPGGAQVRCMKSGSGHTMWANANSFRSCTFSPLGSDRAYSVLNPGIVTNFIDCTFECGVGGVACPVAANFATFGAPNVVNFYGCGFWDVTSGSTPWIGSTVATAAWGFYGCYFDCPPTGPTFSFSSHNGLVIASCLFNSPGGGTPNIFDPAHTITNGSWQGNVVRSPVVDNHASVFV